MLLSVTLGALLYALIQFVWYSPILFGQQWLSLKHTSPEALVGGLKSPQIVPESILQIIAPAFLMSAAIHALVIVLARFGIHIFWMGVMFMFLTTALPKYRHWSRMDSDARSLHFLGDGALAASLLLLALFVPWSSNTLY
ncbi:MAG: DUF1761 family protein [Candidatus Moraniibacteriota bacterium]|nr:MAG: DUF1761 family protein [Candidatus Moranbacteria bacterium]